MHIKPSDPSSDIFFEVDEVCTHRCENILKITAFIASLILLTVAVIASLVSTGVLTETFYLYSLHQIGQLGSSIFLTLSLLSTVVLGIILIKSCLHAGHSSIQKTTL